MVTYNSDFENDTLSRLFKDIIVIEGSDGSGKKTQAIKLREYILKHTDIFPFLLDFPDYESDTGALITSMLHGKFGKDTANLNPYFTSPMYGLDRYQYLVNFAKSISFRPSIAISNRYVSSNLIHQGARLSNDDLIAYWNWLYDFEFNKLCLPKPSITIYLDIPYEVSYENIKKRSKETGTDIDINEQEAYLELVRKNTLRLKNLVDWKFINCYDEENERMRSEEDIHKDILKEIHSAHIETSNLFMTI